MDGVYNRKLFAKKSQEARNALREMGGVDPMPPQMGGILASSPELMQAAAMRRPVVLPATQAPVAPTPAPQPQPQMLPPSSPLPNIAGIPQAQAPAPRPMAQKPGVKKMNEGGILDYKGPRSGMTLREKFQNPGETTMRMFQRGVETPLTFGFKKAFEFGQKAITTEDPTKLGLPEGANMAEPAKILEKDPEAAAADIITATVPKDQQTGDTKTDLRKAATMTGIEQVPAEAKIDELNKAIFGAKLAGAISGSYVNPNTGQELRPTLGARMSQATVEGLAVERDTAERRAKQEAALAAAKMRSAGKSTSGKIPPNLKVLVDIFKKRAETEDIATVAANFNEQYGDNTGTMIMEYIRTGALTPPQPQNTGGGADSPPEPTTYPPGSIINQGGNRFRVDDNGVPQLIQGE
jgi:hypothetical protein